MAKSSALAAAVCLALLVAPAIAQDEPDRCYTTTDPRGDDPKNTFYNPSATQNWQQTRANADSRVMQAMAGEYRGQFNDPTGQMVEYVRRIYDANGLWSYDDRTCTINSSLPCSENHGEGQWAAYQQQDGTIFLMIHFSDLARYNNCFSQTLQLQNGGFTDTSGGNWQKVR
jgi:hypothetical protein